MKLDIGAPVHTRDGHQVGEVHRVVVDLVDSAVTGIVVLKGHLLSRDVLVPLDFIDRADEHGVVLRLDEDQLDQLPDFAFNEILAPPPAWTSAVLYPDGTVYVPIRQRKRLSDKQFDITRGTRVWATDGEIGNVDDVELDALTGELDAFWVRAGAIFAHNMRIPVEWIDHIDRDDSGDESGIRLKGSKLDIEIGLGPLSRARLASSVIP
jgi:uncharacterized protein YrrD